MDRYLTDEMHGKLTTYLRMTGHDVEYIADKSDEVEPVEHAEHTNRVLITSNKRYKDKENVIVLSSNDTQGALKELNQHGLDLTLDTPRRCSRCNGELVRDTDAWRCLECGHIYWRGSHWDDVAETLAEIKKD